MARLRFPIALFLGSACAALAGVPAAAEGVSAPTAPAAPATSTADAAPDAATADPQVGQKALCDLIETAAADNGLPVSFFTRLIWKESRFRSDAVSPKGAQGIAQFMPGTAAERGLADPFDARAAIPASASYLSDLSQRFGNLGLAAAAYNAGPDRVSDWLAEDGTLPFESSILRSFRHRHPRRDLGRFR